MANQANPRVLLDLINSVSLPGEIHPALAHHVTMILRSYLVEHGLA